MQMPFLARIIMKNNNNKKEIEIADTLFFYRYFHVI